MISVLYVDDEHDLLEIGKLFLEQYPDLRVDVHTSAKEALASPLIGKYDAIVSDYQMPEMDGIEFLKNVRGKYGDVPFILFTGRGREEIVIPAINNGVDFYLQKGGDVRAQFAELAHKIRQAVARRKAEISLIESEKRLSDIINFLPDATFAINRDGIIIAWNRAIEEMTGLPAETILGKGDHEYALPFYGERRPILIDLIFEPSEVIEQKYSHIVRQKDILIADTTLPRLKGKEVTLLGKASPLYNSQGEIVGAIEAIRDITLQKNAEDELRAAYEQITASEEELRDQLDVLEGNEKKIRESEARLRYMIGFYEKAKGPEGELLGYAVEGAGAVTESPLGYLAFLNDDETELSMYAWSRSAMEECAIRDKPIVYKTAKTGLWGEAVRQRCAVITNDYAAPNPAKKGYPPGHPEIVRHMNVPIMDGGHIVLVAGVANKPADYTDTDVQELQLLMQSLWLVVKRRRTEGALLESEEKYRDLFENSVLGIFRTTREGKFSAINGTLARIAGYDSPQQMMETIKDVRTQLYVNPEDRERFVNGLKTDGLVKDFEAQYYHRDGHAVWILINARAVRDLQGEVRYYEGTIEDITGQKKDKEDLLREKLFSDAVLESIPGLLYLYDSDGKLVRWNKSHETVSGYSAEELGRMHLPDWFKGDDEAIRVISEGVGRAMKEGQSSAVAKLLTKSGKRIPFFFTAKRLEIEGRTYFTGVGIDITDRQRDQDELRAAYEQLSASQEELQGQLDELVVSEQRIRESEVKYRELAELLPQMVFEMDPDLRVTYANRYAFSALGLTGQDIAQGLSALSCIDPGQHDRARRAIETLIAGTPEANPEYTGIRRDGTTFPILVYTAPVYHAGVLAGFRGVVVDITDRKQAEDALKESEERYRNVIELSPLGMHFYELLPDGPLIFTGANPAADSILGIDNNRFIGKPIEEAFPGLLGTEIPDQYRKVAADGGVWHTDQMIYEQGEIRGAFAVQASRIRPGAMVAVFYDITKRKQAEEALRESEEKYRTILETIQDVYYRSDVAGNLVMASPSIAGLLGYERVDALIGRNIAEDIWLYPGNRPAFIDEMKKQGSVSNYEVILKRKDGSPVTVATSSHFHYDLHGEIDGVEGIFHDITAIRNADQQINLLAALIDISPVSVTVHDTEGRFLYANQRTFDLHGYTREEFMTLNLHQLDVPVSEELINERIGMLKTQGETSFDVEHFRKDGSRIPLHVTAKIARWNDRDMILSVATDLSERLDAERILSESEALYRTVIENIQDAFIRSDRNGRIIMASLSAATMLGFDKPDDLIGKSMSAFYKHPELRQALLDKMAKEGKIADQTIELQRNDGSTFWGSANFHCLYTAEGEMDGVEGSLHDVTGYRAMEQAVREANHKLNLLNSMTRHDVTNQLTALQGFAQIAAMKKGDPVMTDYLVKIMKAADTIARQIEFTRTYQELGVKAPAWTTVEDVITRVESRVPVTFSGTCRGIEILADPMLERVFFNLFDNAVRHGGRVTEITVRCEREPDGILVIVEDNGTGVEIAEKERIFNRGVGKNTGLGLFLVREILSITGITIKETGVYGKGARFEISVPEGMYRFVRP